MISKWSWIMLFLLIALSYQKPLIFPPPLYQKYYLQYPLSPINPCLLFINVETNMNFDTNYYAQKIINRLNKNTQCAVVSQQHKINLAMNNNIAKEGYYLLIKKQQISIQISDYSGYVYAMQTLYQLLIQGQLYQTFIRDQPLVQHRGIMIDSVRHFISPSYIWKLIQTMPISKLNVLHWHLSDDETMPLLLKQHPQLAKDSIYSNQEYYSYDDVAKIIDLATKNGIQIVPEIDTPAHVRSWGLSQVWKDKGILIKCGGGEGYNGQFDLSKPEVYKLAGEVISQVNQLFKSSPYIHLGGDEVGSSCWDLRPAIKDFMKTKGINTYGQLQQYWRSQMLKYLPAGRRTVYWLNTAVNGSYTNNDIIHYWGAQNKTKDLVGDISAKIILSPSDYLYLNKGQGFIWGNTFGQYTVWKNLYQNFIVFPTGVDKSRILGAQVCLWGQVSNQDTLQNNLWMRASAFGARVWSQNILPMNQIVSYLVKTQKILQDLDVDVSPITSNFCQINPIKCFGGKQQQPAKKHLNMMEQINWQTQQTLKILYQMVSE